MQFSDRQQIECCFVGWNLFDSIGHEWKTFQRVTTIVNKDNKSFQFSNVPHIGLLWYLDSEEILMRGK